MNDNSLRYSPSEAEELTGYTADFMREARRRRFGLLFGKRQPNGRYAFSIQDLIGLVVARRLHELGFRQELAFPIGASAATYVIDHLIDPMDVAKNNCVVAFLDEDEPENTVPPICSVSEIQRICSDNDREICLFPIRPLANAVPKHLKTLVLEAVGE